MGAGLGVGACLVLQDNVFRGFGKECSLFSFFFFVLLLGSCLVGVWMCATVTGRQLVSEIQSVFVSCSSKEHKRTIQQVVLYM